MKASSIIALIAAMTILFVGGFFMGVVSTAKLYAGNYYPAGFIVTEVNKDSDIVTIESSTGFLFQFSGCEDWEIGDGCAAIMDRCGTPEVIDDKIVRVTYTGYNQE